MKWVEYSQVIDSAAFPGRGKGPGPVIPPCECKEAPDFRLSSMKRVVRYHCFFLCGVRSIVLLSRAQEQRI